MTGLSAILALGMVAQNLASPQGVPNSQGNALRELNNAIAAAWASPNPTVRQFSQPIWRNFQAIRDVAQADLLPFEVQAKLRDDARSLAALAPQFQIGAQGLADLKSVHQDLEIKARAAQTTFAVPAEPLPPSFPAPPPEGYLPLPPSIPAPPPAGYEPQATGPRNRPPSSRADLRPTGASLIEASYPGRSPRPVEGTHPGAGTPVTPPGPATGSSPGPGRPGDVEGGDIAEVDGVLLALNRLPFPPQPAKVLPAPFSPTGGGAGAVIMADRWVRAVSIITKVQNQEMPGLDVYCLDRGEVGGPVPGARLRFLGQSKVDAMRLPWGTYLIFATRGEVPRLVEPNRFTRIDVQVYPDLSNSRPLTFKVEAR